MISFQSSKTFTRCVSSLTMLMFMVSSIVTPSIGYTQQIALPQVAPTASFSPATIQGINLYANDPLKFDFIINRGDSTLTDKEFRDESNKLIKYFLAALTVPQNEMWVNLSPYEKDRIIPQQFGNTEMGRELLAQDYMLKQLVASLMYPEKDIGAEFWKKVYEQTQNEFNTTDIPMDTFNKVWIVPQEAEVYEHEKGAFIVKSKLKVLLEEDYLAMEQNQNTTKHGLGNVSQKDLKPVSEVTSKLLREIVIPAIEKEVNEGKTFANLRQIYNAVILASWYKQALRESFLGQVYVDQHKMEGVSEDNISANQKIYEQYVEAFKKGAYEYIKEDYDPKSQQLISRKYFSGGVRVEPQVSRSADRPNFGMLAAEDYAMATVNLDSHRDKAMTAEEAQQLGFSDNVVENIRAGIVVSQQQEETLRILAAINEQSVLNGWDASGVNDDKKRAHLDQLAQLNKGYSGGLQQYKDNARRLLKASQEGKNPFEGFAPSVPEGTQLTEVNREYKQMEREGLKAFNKTAGVIVAGGVGDRLGYKGIKVGIPLDLITMKSYLQHYVENILALQEKSNRLNDENRKVPLVIMTSDDTHDLTVKLLGENNYFGADGVSINPSKEDVSAGRIKQIIILRQGMVPAMVDSNGKFVLDEKDPYKLQVKPHGHGDIHMLIKQSGLDELWLKEGRTHTFFFQDTNGVVFNAVLPGLANSIQKKFSLNFLTVPREAGEKAGAITRMKHQDGRDQVFNVEYNELDPLLKATVNPKGDQADPITGKSPFPGNLNVFIVENGVYHEKLTETGGIFGEFINPKYADATKTSFKAPTRSETMMQDYAKSLPGEKVGFTNFDKRDVFSPVKNDAVGAAAIVKNGNYPDAMATGEGDFYAANRKRFALAGVQVDVKGTPRTVLGVPFNEGAKIIYSPAFAYTVEELQEKVRRGSISNRSVLLIDGEDIDISSLYLDGTLEIHTAPGVTLRIEGFGFNVSNDGWEFVDLTQAELNDPNVPQAIKMRGYRLEKKAQMIINIQRPGIYTINGDRVYEQRSGTIAGIVTDNGVSIGADSFTANGTLDNLSASLEKDMQANILPTDAVLVSFRGESIVFGNATPTASAIVNAIKGISGVDATKPFSYTLTKQGNTVTINIGDAAMNATTTGLDLKQLQIGLETEFPSQIKAGDTISVLFNNKILGVTPTPTPEEIALAIFTLNSDPSARFSYTLSREGNKVTIDIKDAAMKTRLGEPVVVEQARPETPGGIDMNPTMINMNVNQGAGKVVIPQFIEPIEDFITDGFSPIIINVQPITNLPLLLGFAGSGTDETAGYDFQPMDRKQIGDQAKVL